jgi:ribosome-associated protein
MNPEPLIAIPNSELRVIFSRSSGPGGQNVNRRESRVQLRFSVPDSQVLSEEQKAAILSHPLLKSRIDADGVIQVAVETHRKQRANLEEAVNRLQTLLQRALKPKTPRKPTRTPKSATRRRLAAKKQRAAVKTRRSEGKRVQQED